MLMIGFVILSEASQKPYIAVQVTQTDNRPINAP